MTKANLLNTITYNPKQCGGRPCIRGMRIRVADILEMLVVLHDQELSVTQVPT